MNDRFDQHIKSRIYSTESEVPDQLWNAIENELRPKKNRRWMFFLLLPVLLLVLYNLVPLKMDYTNNSFDTPAPEEDKLTTTNETKSAEPVMADFIPSEKLYKSAAESVHSQEKNLENSNRIFKQTTDPASKLIGQHGIAANLPDPIGENSGIAEIIRQVNPEQSAFPSQASALVSFTTLDKKSFAPLSSVRDPKIDVCPSFSSKIQLRLFSEISLTGGLPVKMLTVQDRELDDYRNLRDRTEKERTSMTFTGLIGMEIGDRFEIKTGLSSTSIYEVFDYVDESASRTITNIITDTIFVNGVPEIRTDTSIITQYGQRIKLSQNRLTTLDLPLLAAYKFKVQNHQFFLQGGIIYNLALWTKGDLLTPEEEIVSIDSKEPSSRQIFSRHTGFDLTAALGYELELSEFNQLRILCSLRQSIGDYSAPQYPLSQRYRHIHLGVSWKHQF
ncbi:MAG: hypothetical protein KDC80_20650 [Saprospiraceae bacterium]|nr:hypothetical protein [Saprospiraceae bacterium]